MRHDDRYSMVSGICTRDGSAWDHKCEEKSQNWGRKTKQKIKRFRIDLIRIVY